MAKYIDADKLLKNLKKQYGEDLGWQCTINMSDVGMMIEDAPTADVVEVVRCKDCEYYAPLGDDYEYKGKKAMHCILRASCTGDNYYCADGMRKEKDND